jgi:uncharacterized protein with beta-barrel porin domain
MNATAVRSELGARFDDPTLPYGKPLILFGRLARAHDWVSNPALGAMFQSLLGASFTVNGAPIPQNSALVSAGAQLFPAPNWTLLAKFDGEFASGSHTYAGSGTLRCTWWGTRRWIASAMSPFGPSRQLVRCTDTSGVEVQADIERTSLIRR